MSLTLKDIRVPTPRVRAEKILAAIKGGAAASTTVWRPGAAGADAPGGSVFVGEDLEGFTEAYEHSVSHVPFGNVYFEIDSRFSPVTDLTFGAPIANIPVGTWDFTGITLTNHRLTTNLGPYSQMGFAEGALITGLAYIEGYNLFILSENVGTECIELGDNNNLNMRITGSEVTFWIFEAGKAPFFDVEAGGFNRFGVEDGCRLNFGHPDFEVTASPLVNIGAGGFFLMDICSKGAYVADGAIGGTGDWQITRRDTQGAVSNFTNRSQQPNTGAGLSFTTALNGFTVKAVCGAVYTVDYDNGGNGGDTFFGTGDIITYGAGGTAAVILSTGGAAGTLTMCQLTGALPLNDDTITSDFSETADVDGVSSATPFPLAGFREGYTTYGSVLRFDTTLQDVEVDMLPARRMSGAVMVVKNHAGANTVTVIAAAGELIDGSPTADVTAGKSNIFASDDADPGEWVLIGGF